MEGNSGVKQGSNNKGKCNSPIFRTQINNIMSYKCAKYIGLLLDPFFLPYYTTIAFQSYFLIENVFLLVIAMHHQCQMLQSVLT